jgi:hypothetical protein
MSDLDLDRPLYGAPAISREIQRSMSQTYYALERGFLPATKMGSIWVSTPRRLRDWLNGHKAQHAGMNTARL